MKACLVSLEILASLLVVSLQIGFLYPINPSMRFPFRTSGASSRFN